MATEMDGHIDVSGDTVLGLDRSEFPAVLRERETLTVGDLFFDGFVRDNTEFDTFDEFLSRSPWELEAPSDFDDVPRADLDAFVHDHTAFDGWKLMVEAASDEYVQRNTSY